MNREEVEFLQQSNYIEGEFDADSLAQAIYAWNYLKDSKELTIPIILNTHRILMMNQNLLPYEIGVFRKVPVWVGSMEGMKHGDIPEAVEEWCDMMNEFTKAGHKDEEEHKILHVAYEKIHPFVDGNGRTGRMFMNWARLQVGLPILVIHEGDEQMEYYQWFK